MPIKDVLDAVKHLCGTIYGLADSKTVDGTPIELPVNKSRFGPIDPSPETLMWVTILWTNICRNNNFKKQLTDLRFDLGDRTCWISDRIDPQDMFADAETVGFQRTHLAIELLSLRVFAVATFIGGFMNKTKLEVLGKLANCIPDEQYYSKFVEGVRFFEGNPASGKPEAMFEWSRDPDMELPFFFSPMYGYGISQLHTKTPSTPEFVNALYASVVIYTACIDIIFNTPDEWGQFMELNFDNTPAAAGLIHQAEFPQISVESFLLILTSDPEIRKHLGNVSRGICAIGAHEVIKVVNEYKVAYEEASTFLINTSLTWISQVDTLQRTETSEPIVTISDLLKAANDEYALICHPDNHCWTINSSPHMSLMCDDDFVAVLPPTLHERHVAIKSFPLEIQKYFRSAAVFPETSIKMGVIITAIASAICFPMQDVCNWFRVVHKSAVDDDSTLNVDKMTKICRDMIQHKIMFDRSVVLAASSMSQGVMREPMRNLFMLPFEYATAEEMELFQTLSYDHSSIVGATYNQEGSLQPFEFQYHEEETLMSSTDDVSHFVSQFAPRDAYMSSAQEQMTNEYEKK